MSSARYPSTRRHSAARRPLCLLAVGLLMVLLGCGHPADAGPASTTSAALASAVTTSGATTSTALPTASPPAMTTITMSTAVHTPIAVDLVVPVCPPPAPPCDAGELVAVAAPALRAAVPEVVVETSADPSADRSTGPPSGHRPAPAEVRGGALILVAIGVSRT